MSLTPFCTRSSAALSSSDSTADLAPLCAKSNRCLPKMKFTAEEDKILREVVKDVGTKNWNAVAQELPGRNGRQCRERWNNYVNPKFRKGEFTKEEDQLLDEKYKEFGPRWHMIAACFPNRSCNMIKNRFFTRIRRSSKQTSKPKHARQITASIASAQTSQQQNQPLEELEDIIDEQEWETPQNEEVKENVTTNSSDVKIASVAATTSENSETDNQSTDEELFEDQISRGIAMFSFLDNFLPKNEIAFSSESSTVNSFYEILF